LESPDFAGADAESAGEDGLVCAVATIDKQENARKMRKILFMLNLIVLEIMV
jgi:hypothetical protein